MEFEITEVEIPTKNTHSRLSYPLSEMKPGTSDSFHLDAVTPEAVKKVSSSVRTFAYRNGMTVVLREEDNGIRVWRKS